MKIAYALIPLSLALLSCKSTDAGFESSDALDPVGSGFRKQQVAKQIADSKYKPGDKITMRNSQVMVFNRNPQKYTASGDVIAAEDATVIMPEGLFIKVKFNNGRTGYINESDIMEPMDNFNYASGEGIMPPFMMDDHLPSPSSDTDSPEILQHDATDANDAPKAEPAAGLIPDLPPPAAKAR